MLALAAGGFAGRRAGRREWHRHRYLEGRFLDDRRGHLFPAHHE